MVYLVIAAMLIATVAPAHAYIDAGSGSYMIQMAMAGILAVVFTLKLYWQRLRAFLSRLFTGKNNAETHSEE